MQQEENKIEQYKLLLDIYYHELPLLYTKITVFTTIQLAGLTAVLLSHNKLSNSLFYGLALILLWIISLFQILITKRGNLVNNALINTIADFENKAGYHLLQDFSCNVKKLSSSKLSQMNFPSSLFVYIGISFLMIWTIVIVCFLLSYYDFSIWLNKNHTVTYFNLPIMVILSTIFAITMKISDLLDEHGLKWFKGADILFGIFCGISGVLLIVSNKIIANIILAMIIGFVIRRRIDYLNHAIAFLIISSGFFLFSNLISEIYFPFLFAIIILGLIKDLKYKKNKSKFVQFICKIFLHIPIIYTLPSLLYSFFSSNWYVFIVFFIYDTTYNIVRLVWQKNSKQNK